MAEFLTTSQTVASIENLISNAKGLLVFITPFVQISETLYQRMLDASSRGVSITFVYGKSDMKQDELNRLIEIPRIKVHFYENLHAKCYYNENKLIITSLNLYEYSSKNREMGVLVDKNQDKELYTNAINESASIIKHSSLINISKSPSHNFNPRQNTNLSPSGVCIRCQTKIKLDGDRPLCSQCYNSWSQYMNIQYPENFCHGCGKQHLSSMEKPFCYSCFRKY